MRRQRGDASEQFERGDGKRSLAAPDSLPSQVLRRMELGSHTWKTLLIWSAASADFEPGLAWHTWKNIEAWPQFSPVVAEAWWLSGDQWRPGSEFVEVSNLGFPVGRRRTTHRVVSVDHGRSAEWSSVGRGLKTARLWRFEPRIGGGVQISAVAVFHGASIGVTKHVVARRWRDQLQDQVDGVVAMAQSNSQDRADRRTQERKTSREATTDD